MKKRLYLICFAFVACKQNNEPTYLQVVSTESGDNNVTQEQLDIITKDVNSLLGCEAISVESSSERIFYRVRSNDERVQIERDKRDNQHIAGLHLKSSREIFFDSALLAESKLFIFRRLMLHELGHAFDLKHEYEGMMSFPAADGSYEDHLVSFAELMERYERNPCTYPIN